MEEHYEIVQFSIKYRNYSRIAFVLRNFALCFIEKTFLRYQQYTCSHFEVSLANNMFYVLIGRRDYFNASFYDSKLKIALLHRSLIFFFQHHTNNNETKKCVDA